MKWEFEIIRNAMDRQVYAFLEGVDHKQIAVVETMTMQTYHDDRDPPRQPFLQMPYADADPFLQAICDGLHKAGYRPGGFEDFTRERSAMNAHLEDMRRLVFENLPALVDIHRKSTLSAADVRGLVGKLNEAIGDGWKIGGTD